MNDQDPEDRNSLRTDTDLCIHIFSVSAAMVGVCLTVIGIFQIGTLKALNSIGDNILAVDALLFLSSCAIAYVALRSEQNTRQMLEKIADAVFLIALALMAVVCVLIAYTFI
jgi:hypothetical protein